MQTFEIYFSDLNDEAKARLLRVVSAKTAADMNWDMDLVPIATYDFEEDQRELFVCRNCVHRDKDNNWCKVWKHGISEEDCCSYGEANKANEIALDYEKYHLGEEMDYWIGMHTMIRISLSHDITYGYCVELYEYGPKGDGLVDVLTETKETLADGVEYLLALV